MSELMGLPTLASEHGGEIDFIVVAIHVVMLLALLLWGGFFIFSLVRFRRKKNPKADYGGLKTRLPYIAIALIAIAEMVLLLGFSVPFWERQIAATPEYDEPPFEVRVVAQQFAWNVHYPGPDGVFGRTALELIDSEINPLGLDGDDPASRDDVVALNQLHVPKGRPVLVRLTSRDVIHGFSIPEFRVKHDAIPGMAVAVHFTPTMTTAEFREQEDDVYRNFEIACAQLCGNSHYRMRGMVVVETDDEFATWYEQRLEYMSFNDD